MTAQPIKAAAAVMLCRGSRIWLGTRGKTRFLPGFSVFPGGVGEAGESTRQAALRELAEETGVVPPRERLLVPFARAITPAYSHYRYDVEVFLLELPEELEPEPDGLEFIGGNWYTVEEALQARVAGELQLAPPTFRQLVQWENCRKQEAPWPDEAAAFAEPSVRDEHVLPFAPGLTVVPLPTLAMPPAAWTNTVLLGNQNLYIIDPGGPEIQILMEEIAHHQAAGAQVKGVILSHHHPDHLDGYHALQMSHLPLYCHPLTRPLLPADFPVTTDLHDGQKIEIEEGLTLVCHFSPGHAPGHLAFELPERSAMLAGDMISSLSSIVLPPDDGSLPDYLESLSRLQKRDCNLIVPSHGPPWGRGSDPFGETILHRQKREEQILALLGSEARTVESVASRLYRAVDPRLMPAARANVKHHLLKLASENRAVETDLGWTRGE
ncbi:MAG: MBL fold metallo-hydrolase [Vulcanimicrobiota bacterium]